MDWSVSVCVLGGGGSHPSVPVLQALSLLSSQDPGLVGHWERSPHVWADFQGEAAAFEPGLKRGKQTMVAVAGFSREVMGRIGATDKH